MDVLALAKIKQMQRYGCVGHVDEFNECFFDLKIDTEPNEELGGLSSCNYVWSDGDINASLFKSVIEKMIVVWDEKEWEYDVSGFIDGYMLGNLSFVDPESPDTGEPFLIVIDVNQKTAMIITKTPSEHQVSLFFIGKLLFPMSTKFLPDVIAGKNGIRIVKFVSKSGKKFDLSIDDNGNLTAIETAT